MLLSQVLFVEVGFGADQHGQNVTVKTDVQATVVPWAIPNGISCLHHDSIVTLTKAHQQCSVPPVQKAAARACRNAIEFNSLPSMGKLIPGGYPAMRLHIKIGVPHPVSAAPAQATWQFHVQHKVLQLRSKPCPVFQNDTSQASGLASILACLIRHTVATLWLIFSKFQCN